MFSGWIGPSCSTRGVLFTSGLPGRMVVTEKTLFFSTPGTNRVLDDILLHEVCAEQVLHLHVTICAG